MKHLMSIAVFALTVALGIGQEQSFSLEVSSDSILVGNYIEVRFVLINIEGEFQAPNFDGMRIVSGPNQSSSMSSINGDVRQQRSYSYFVEPIEEGEYFLDPVFVESADRTWETDPMKITVYPNPEGIIERPVMNQHFHFEFGDIFGDDQFFKRKENVEQPKKKSKVKRRKI